MITPLPPETLAWLHQAAAAGVASLWCCGIWSGWMLWKATGLKNCEPVTPMSSTRDLLARLGRRTALPVPEVCELTTLFTVGASCGGGARLSQDQCALAATLLQQLSAPAPAVAPAERLAERLRSAVRLSGGSLMDDEWQTVIREVAAWAGEQSIFDKPEVWAERLEQEAYQ